MNATAERKRAKTARACIPKLEAACVALRAFLHACNECGDASMSLSAQGKGIDGRETLIRNMAEYASYLDGVYSADGLDGKGARQ